MKYVLLLFSIFLFACSQKTTDRPSVSTPTLIRYLALGDSYTIGESVAPTDRFPAQLKDSLVRKGIFLEEPLIIARTGWTTADLENGIANEGIMGDTFELVTLLIGVNNQYRGHAIEDYGPAFKALLEKAIRLAGNNKDHVFVLSIPDYAYTPFGQQRPDPDQISAEIDAYNAVNRYISENLGVAYFDITPITRQGLDKPALVANDGLHPSSLMYSQWINQMLPVLTDVLP